MDVRGDPVQLVREGAQQIVRGSTALLVRPGIAPRLGRFREQTVPNRMPSRDGGRARQVLRVLRSRNDRLLAFGNALQHSKLTYLVFTSGGRFEVDFRLIDAVVARERVHDPSDVAGAPHIS